jgi:hypothetical protein
MKTSVFLGENVGKVENNCFATYKLYEMKSITKTEKEIENLFKNINATKQLMYTIEHNRFDGLLHSHLLFKNEDYEGLDSDLKKYINPKRITKGTKYILAKIPKTEKDIVNDVKFKDIYVLSNFTNYIGSNSEIYLESAVYVANASIYAFKYCSYGLNNGYLIK